MNFSGSHTFRNKVLRVGVFKAGLLAGPFLSPEGVEISVDLCNTDAHKYFYLQNKYTPNQAYSRAKAITASQSSIAYFALVFHLA